MSRVQVEALRIVLMMEDIKERDERVERLRLAWLGHEWAHIKERFPEYFPQAETVVTEASEEVDIEAALTQELAGASSEWELQQPKNLNPAEISALIAKLTSGTASPGLDSDWM